MSQHKLISKRGEVFDCFQAIVDFANTFPTELMLTPTFVFGYALRIGQSEHTMAENFNDKWMNQNYCRINSSSVDFEDHERKKQ